MSTLVLCDIDYCAYNRDGKCGKEAVSISRKNFSGFCDGEREWAPACEDYRELSDDAD